MGVNQVPGFSSALTTTSRHAGPADWLPARGPAIAARAKGQQAGLAPPALAANGLPRAGTVLAVTARPGCESGDLGALLYAFGQAGARLALLSLTRGEASPVNSTCNRLEAVRPWELQLASMTLGISSVAVADYPDGGLGRSQLSDLTARIQRAITEHAPDLILVADPADGDSDDARVAQAVCLAAQRAGVAVAARTVHGARGSWPVELGSQAADARAAQRSAARAHASQSETLPGVLDGLDRLGSHEQLRWLLPVPVSSRQVIAPRAIVERRQIRMPSPGNQPAVIQKQAADLQFLWGERWDSNPPISRTTTEPARACAELIRPVS
jgi:N-acetylglucosamine malate deacetylase 2